MKDQERFWMYLVCFGLLAGGCILAFVIGVATNNDACFVVALGFFAATVLLTSAWSVKNRGARWILAVLGGLTALMGANYLRFRHQSHAAQMEMEQMIETERMKHAAQMDKNRPIRFSAMANRRATAMNSRPTAEHDGQYGIA